MLPKKSIKEDRFEREIEYKLSEKEICKAFLKEYNKKNRNDYRFVRPGDPIKGEPSCICIENLNIEITVYYNKEEAKAAWVLVKSMKKRAKNKNNDGLAFSEKRKSYSLLQVASRSRAEDIPIFPVFL
jgi:hypothetical protein